MSEAIAYLPGSEAEPLLRQLSTWQNVTTIILHGGSVFEIKGVFPAGENAHGFYNLTSSATGFEGHLNLALIARIKFQDKPHRGRDSYAFDFQDAEANSIFKVFLGRDQQGQIWPQQLTEFKRLRDQHQA